MRGVIARLNLLPGIAVLALSVPALFRGSAATAAELLEDAESYVGLSARVEQIVLPGPKLKVRPLSDRRRPLVLRIEEAYPHGSDFRYDLVYYGLEPGEYDLGDYLLREDGTAPDDLPPLPVKILGSLPPGQITPSPLQPGSLPRVGGYRLLAALAGAVWVGGLAAILLLGRGRSKGAVSHSEPSRSLDEQLQDAIETILSGRFTESDKSRLERLLLAYWRRRLNLQDLKPDEAMAALRAHPTAAHLLDQLERWLHQPAGLERIDVVELLRPYRIPAGQRHIQGENHALPDEMQTTEGPAR